MTLPGIACVVFNYEGLPALKSELRTRIEEASNSDWGLKTTDTSTHRPIIILLTAADDADARAGLHHRSEEAKKRRKAKERERQKRLRTEPRT